MDRQELISKAYDRSASLTVDNREYRKRVLAFTNALVEEDVGENGDITSESVLLDANPKTSAQLIARGGGICAGLEEATWFYHQNGLEVTMTRHDGEVVDDGHIIMSLFGNCKDLLRTERVGLNLIQRMSGIATLTNQLIQRIDSKALFVAATRKTPCGALDKKAVAVGKGMTHRLGLWDSILIKENHLTILKQNGFTKDYIDQALDRAFQCQITDVVEIEVQNPQEAVNAAQKFRNLSQKRTGVICIILFDNFNPSEIRETIDSISSRSADENLLFEASGNITPDNLTEFAEAGVDVVSMGYLTHSPDAFDISQLHEYEI